MKKIKILALLGLLPRRLAEARATKCQCCIFGSMAKNPWRIKGYKNKTKLRVVKKAGECVSVDQLESRELGFVAQLKGRLTKDRYNSATVFVDHYSRFSYVHPQKSLTSEETSKAKRAFEAYARTLGVKIQHYHADNGRFADNAFINDVEKEGQTISYCGVNAHFQNGIAEKLIRDLQERARTVLLHAKVR